MVSGDDFKLVKTPGQHALRLKLLERERLSRNHYTEAPELSKMGELMQESIEAKRHADLEQVQPLNPEPYTQNPKPYLNSKP
jgi:hypothetical protein